MLNWILRYEPVIGLLDEMGATDVLDVGSGWSGLSWYWPHRVVQTDLNFAGQPPPESERQGEVTLVRSTAEKLPFAADSFDVAVALDMMEHLPEHLRRDSVRELARVSRRGFITGFPVGKPADRVDRWLVWLFGRTPGCSVPDWLEEHRSQDRYPDRTTLLDAMPAGWHIAREVPSGNVLAQTAVVYAEALPRTGRVLRAAERRVHRAGTPAMFDRGRTYRTIWLAVPDGTQPLPELAPSPQP